MSDWVDGLVVMVFIAIMSDSYRERLWEIHIQWKLVLVVIPIYALKISHTRHVTRVF